MKSKIFLGMMVSIALTSCADNFDRYFDGGNPEKVGYEYLNEYQPLKEYVDRAKYPNFLLGGGVSAEEYNKGGLFYALANTNFDEIVTGNAMKYASIVDDNGAMNFATVEDFVNNATEAGMNIYGHTLAWHAQQRPNYLNMLIADYPDPNWVPEDGKNTNYIHYDCGDPGANSWDKQATYTLPEGNEMKQGENYILKVDIRAKQEGVVGLWPIWANSENRDQWGNSADVQYLPDMSVNTEWKTVTWTFNAMFPHDKLQFVFGKMGGFVDFDNLTLTEAGSEEDLIDNGNFEKASTKGWGANWGGPQFEVKQDGETRAATRADIKFPEFPFYTDVLVNGDLKTDDNSCFTTRTFGAGGDVHSVIEGGKLVVPGAPRDGTDWDNQFFITAPNHIFPAGEKTRVTFDYMADHDATGQTQCHAMPGGYIHWGAIGDVSFKTTWQTLVKDFIIPAECDGRDMQTLAFNLAVDPNANTYYFKNLKWEVAENKKTVVPNYNVEGDDMSGFIVKTNIGNTPGAVHEANEENFGRGEDGGRCLAIHAGAKVADAWDNQFWINTPLVTFDGGEKCRVTFRYKADKEAKASTQCHAGAGEYIHWAAIGDVNFTTSWQTYVWEGTIPGECAGRGMHSIAFNLNELADENTYYFDDITWECDEITKKPDTPMAPMIPQTPEEKKDTLTKAMDAWIEGMMTACNGKVTAFDVVNEPISGADTDGDGIYDLQHGSADNTTDFFWQDYLGDEDYVRTVVSLARKYGPQDLKLFVNDYNLESWWDDNKKAKSLVEWIRRWEADGKTKIDGIGSQMHISYYEEAGMLNSLKQHIENMYDILVKSGKLIRVSEFDMGFVGVDGNEVMTKDLTEEQHKAMSEFWKWNIETYLAKVPANQQWGFCVWAPTDSPEGSGWRAGSPLGLWDLEYYRKHTYAGFADGLQGK